MALRDGSDGPGPGWVEALPDRARQLLPAPVWRYFSAGSGTEISLGEAESAWREIRFAPRVLIDVRAIDPTTTLLGTPYAVPVGVAPTSLQRLADPEGERAMMAGAAAAGAPVVVSSNAGLRFSELPAVPWWLQLYVTPDRAQVEPVIEAAVQGGASAIVLTLDTPMPGRKRDVDDADWTGIDLSWHRANYGSGRAGWAMDLGEADLRWVAETSGLPIVAKGILRADDARRAVDAGARAVWVSNHGGRQLDRAIPTARALPRVVSEVGDRAQVYVDGGIRSGADVLAALALGADAVFLGRPPLYALTVGGAEGVRQLFDEIGGQLVEAMRLGGVPTVSAAGEIQAR